MRSLRINWNVIYGMSIHQWYPMDVRIRTNVGYLEWSHSIVIHYECEVVTIHSCHFSTIPGAFFFMLSVRVRLFRSRFSFYLLLFCIVKHFTLSVYHVKCFRLCTFPMKVMFYRNYHIICGKNRERTSCFFRVCMYLCVYACFLSLTATIV